jgi:hypothetical protein
VSDGEGMNDSVLLKDNSRKNAKLMNEEGKGVSKFEDNHGEKRDGVGSMMKRQRW